MPSPVAILMLLGVLLAGVHAAEEPRPQIPLDDAQRAWVAAHPAFTVALDDANPPLNFRQGDGGYAGISVDYLRLIAAKAGLRLELAGSTWNEALGKAMRHEVDAIMSASYREERRTALDFTEPYCETPEAVVTREDFPAMDGLAALGGRKVAVVRGSVRTQLLQREAAGVQVIEVASAGDGIRALTEGRADAFFDDLPVIQSQIDGMMVSRLRVALLYIQPEAGAQRIGVRNDMPELRAILDKAIAAITPAEHRAIRDRWLHLASGVAVQRDLGLSAAERAWLSAHPVIRVACDPDWAPVEWRDPTGAWRGVSIDYLERLQRMLGVRFEIDPAASWAEARQHARDGRVDVFASLADSTERRRDWGFTQTYVSFPIAIFARSEVGYLHGLDDLVGKRVAVVAGYVEQELLRRDCPGIELVEVPSTHDGLAQLRHGRVHAFVGGLLPTAYSLQEDGDLSVHVAGETPYTYRQSLAVRRDWPELQGILDKALHAIPAEEREAMWRRWVSLTYQRGADLSLLWKIGVPALLLLLAFLYWNRRLRVEIRSRTRAEAELIAYRDRLADLVRERTADLEAAVGRLRRLAAAIDQTAEAIVLASPDGRIGFVNPAFCRITGIAAEAAAGQGLDRIGVSWQEPAVREGRWSGRITGRRGDGAAYELEAAVSAVRDGGGAVVDLLVVLRDVTASRLIEERLAQSQKLEAVGTLAGGIAHDFNNILGAILGAAELAERPGQPEERRRDLYRKVVTASERARALVRQMLTFARATQGESRPVEIAPVVGEALALLRSSLPATIEIRQRLAEGLVVLGDPTRLHQVIMNLGTNAGLAMPEGGVLEIEAAVIEVDEVFSAQHDNLARGPAVRITVRDTGVGMSREVQARIFEPFFTTRDQGKGTGLGLAVVHGIVRDAGGAITVYSEPGGGTTFGVVLPLAQGRAAEPVRSGPLAVGNHERILFVDDEVVLRDVAAEMLRALGYVVTVAADGQEALDQLRLDPGAFDLMITDTTMPRMTGLALIAAARDLAPRMRVILCSGQSEAAPGSRTPGVAFLAKPVTMRELASAVRAALVP